MGSRYNPSLPAMVETFSIVILESHDFSRGSISNYLHGYEKNQKNGNVHIANNTVIIFFGLERLGSSKLTPVKSSSEKAYEGHICQRVS